MPKQKGIFKFKGTISGQCYYQLNGEYIVRKAVGPSRERINTDPAFVNVKRNNQEFAAATHLSKAIRRGLGDTGKAFQDTYMASRLTGRCRKVIQKGSGALGEREANLFNHPNAIIGFPLKKELPLQHIYTAKTVVSTNANRTIITVNIPKSDPHNHNQIPENATHFQLTVALSTVSNIAHQPIENKYITEEPNCNALGVAVQSQPLECKTAHRHISLQLQSPNTNNTPTNVAHTIWLGITYLKQQNNEFESIKTAKAMECIAVL
ncbi:hypothetical protein ITJ86_06265 [Winogradskyella sp. F6397]|uniref:Uncharacterized protein n=1 Tax=Winogradskyella marina TaxID=2785530 RepID=A0ABS0EGU8_9FLAO|nr:hypothetical protein [Winogradskyella marina]MBF8149493.1 hypothetical protein [Winogradskyella marina]